MPKYTLTYFDVRARAEIIRLIFAAAGQEYEDRRIQEFTEPDYQKLMQLKEEDRKFSEEWLEEKAKTPFGQLPTLEVDGQTIAQSKVIATFLARRFGLAGKTDLEDAKAAMIAETAEESFMNAIFSIFVEKDEEKKKERVKKYVSETLPNILTKLEKQVGEKGHFVGDQLTYADIAFYFNSTNTAFLQVQIDWEKYPKLKAVYDNVTSNPGIAKWLKERPQGPF